MILVTGGAGYVGSHFVRRVLATDANAKLVVVDDLSEGHKESLPKDPRVTLFDANIGDQHALYELFRQYDISAVVHFAASAYVGESHEFPFKYFNNNIVNSIKLFEAMENHGVRKIVFSSTCATYGYPQYSPLDEAHPQAPINNYGMTKLVIEQLLQCLHQSKHWSYIALRYFNASGAAVDGNCGESHNPETHLIPLVLQAARGIGPEVHILGDNYDTEDGTCIRDYIHVNDLADAHIAALRRINSDQLGMAINLGTSRGASVKEVIETCRQITGREIPVKVAARRPGDPSRLVADSQMAKKELGWQPQLSLEDIIRSAWIWESNRKY